VPEPFRLALFVMVSYFVIVSSFHAGEAHHDIIFER
jgi:hypothetical protein